MDCRFDLSEFYPFSKLEEGHQEAPSKARSINHPRANVFLARPLGLDGVVGSMLAAGGLPVAGRISCTASVLGGGSWSLTKLV